MVCIVGKTLKIIFKEKKIQSIRSPSVNPTFHAQTSLITFPHYNSKITIFIENVELKEFPFSSSSFR